MRGRGGAEGNYYSSRLLTASASAMHQQKKAACARVGVPLLNHLRRMQRARLACSGKRVRSLRGKARRPCLFALGRWPAQMHMTRLISPIGAAGSDHAAICIGSRTRGRNDCLSRLAAGCSSSCNLSHRDVCQDRQQQIFSKAVHVQQQQQQAAAATTNHASR
jgi:hypothetical protein